MSPVVRAGEPRQSSRLAAAPVGYHAAVVYRDGVRLRVLTIGQGHTTGHGIGVITRHHAHHYLGFAHTQWRLFEKEEPRRVKPLLYVFRVLLTGIYLMRSGEVEANLVTLNETFRLPYVPDLVARKRGGTSR